jgi:hypothetical protein
MGEPITYGALLAFIASVWGVCGFLNFVRTLSGALVPAWVWLILMLFLGPLGWVLE